MLSALGAGALVAAAIVTTPAAPAPVACGWKTFPLPVPSDPTSPAGITTVAAVSATDAWATGFTTNPLSGESSTMLLRWNGVGWRVAPTPGPTAVVAAMRGDAWTVARATTEQ